jgi:hypothetical protein
LIYSRPHFRYQPEAENIAAEPPALLAFYKKSVAAITIIKETNNFVARIATAVP